MRKKLNLVGERFSRLVVLKEVEPYVSPGGHKISKWLCQCDCGTTTEVITNNLRRGLTKSCGCYNEEVKKTRKGKALTHGRGTSAHKYYYLYNTWKGIKRRCFKPGSKSYKNYGARGITMYKPWIDNYLAFEDYILTNLGERPEGLTLDRINNNGHYEPGNLRWATIKVQNNNQRRSKKLERKYKKKNFYKQCERIFPHILKPIKP